MQKKHLREFEEMMAASVTNGTAPFEIPGASWADKVLAVRSPETVASGRAAEVGAGGVAAKSPADMGAGRVAELERSVYASEGPSLLFADACGEVVLRDEPRSKTLRQMWWKGTMPPRHRGRLWHQCIGNSGAVGRCGSSLTDTAAS